MISQNSTPLAIIFVYFFLLWQSIVINRTFEGWICFIFQTLTRWVKAGIGAGQEPQERNWSWDHGGMLLTNLLLLFCSVFSSIHPRISCPGVTPPVYTPSPPLSIIIQDNVPQVCLLVDDQDIDSPLYQVNQKLTNKINSTTNAMKVSPDVRVSGVSCCVSMKGRRPLYIKAPNPESGPEKALYCHQQMSVFPCKTSGAPATLLHHFNLHFLILKQDKLTHHFL